MNLSLSYKIRTLSKAQHDICLFLNRDNTLLYSLLGGAPPHDSTPVLERWESSGVCTISRSVTNKLCVPALQRWHRKSAKVYTVCSEWDKRERVVQQCCIANCERKAFTCTKMITEQVVQGVLQTHGLQSTTSEPTQLCKGHYYLIYNSLQPFPTCVTRQTRLKPTSARACPNPSTIKRYLKETTNFGGSITEGDKVCYL